jgi:hypothetical protein
VTHAPYQQPVFGSKGPSIIPSVYGIQQTQGALPVYASKTQATMLQREHASNSIEARITGRPPLGSTINYAGIGAFCVHAM